MDRSSHWPNQRELDISLVLYDPSILVVWNMLNSANFFYGFYLFFFRNWKESKNITRMKYYRLLKIESFDFRISIKLINHSMVVQRNKSTWTGH